MLEQSIDDHFKRLITSNKEPEESESSTFQKVLNKKFNEIIKYPMIDNEVRCGRYYLRVWVSQ